MKILAIRFENIHSLRGVHEINFEKPPLNEAGLFAITGPTGSGKSTLLDVITLALFNRIARLNTAVSQTIMEDYGGIMTRNTRSCFAEITYKSKGEKYRSHWSIARNRNDNLSPRKQELIHVESGEILESGTKTPEKNQEIIGLTYDQFIKAIVLAQGEFNKLLLAPRRERNKLLEDITGAHHYRQIGRAVFERQSTLKREIELKSATLESFQIFDEAVVNAKKDHLKLLLKNKVNFEKEFEKVKSAVTTKKSLQEKHGERKNWEKEHNKYLSDYEIFKPYGNKLILHERLSKYSKPLQEFAKTNEDFKQVKLEIQRLFSEKEKEISQQEKLLLKSAQLLKQEITVDNVLQSLEAFRMQIEALVNDEKLNQSNTQIHKNQIRNHCDSISKKGYKLKFTDSIELFEKNFITLKTQINQTISESGIATLSQLNEQINEKRTAKDAAVVFIHKKENIDKLELLCDKVLIEIQESEKKIKTYLSEKSTSEKAVVQLSKEVADLEKEINHQRMYQSLEAHRHQLKDNEPCPLCGALEHPYATGENIETIQETLLTEKRETLDTHKKLVISLNANIHSLTNEIRRNSAANDERKQELKNVYSELEKYAAILGWNTHETVGILHQETKKINDSLAFLENTKQAFEIMPEFEELSESLEAFKKSNQQYETIKSQRKSLYQGENIAQEINLLTQPLLRTTATLESLEKQLSQMQEKLEKLKKIHHTQENNLLEIARKEALDTIENLKNSLLKDTHVQRIRERKEALQNQFIQLSERKRNIDEQIKTLETSDTDTRTLEILSEKVAELQFAIDSTNQEYGAITQELKKDEEIRSQRQELLEIIRQLQKRQLLWKKMNDLIGDSNGNKFSEFVQDLTLKQLLGHTNRRLAEFSDRYFIDPSSADKGSDTLFVIDHYMGKARRSIHTLSGGETFLVSLAMALALSDIASRNIKIESLFIDEGFGTLDPETLDQAISVLEKMQHEDERCIGVISHVDELKKRITTQIQLERTSLGYSQISVIG